MPTVPDEKNAGIADGVVINNCWGPKRIIGKNGKVTGVEFMRCTSVRDASGKFAPKYDENDTVTVKCSNVLVAIGQRSDYGSVLAGTKAETPDGRLIDCDKLTFQTAEPDIFVGRRLRHRTHVHHRRHRHRREGAVSIHRYVNVGQSLTIHRNRRIFKELDKGSVASRPRASRSPRATSRPSTRPRSRP